MTTPLLVLLVAFSDPAESYLRDVKPVLVRRCGACHGALKKRAGLRLDTAEAIRTGGDSGAAVEPGDSGASLLIERIADTDPSRRMPPEGEPLSADQIAAIRAWIEAGAPAPKNEPIPSDPRRHWSFRPPVRPAVPDAPRGTNPIDAFLATSQRKVGLIPAPRADEATLIRRVTLDLTGLPPTREEVRAFLADARPDAYERLVDRLLASPRFGERWGRHWMDVWRYSDWDGFGAEIRESRPFLWHWRDWIVESLNADLPYDRMIVLMLAADEAAPGDDRAQRATGFLARNWSLYNRNGWMQNAVEHTSKAFLGLTIHCARCHDHKYDPISQRDYYAFRAVFEPHDVREDHLPIGPEAERDGVPRAFDGKPDVPTYLFARGDERKPDKSRALAADLPAFLKGSGLAIAPVPLPALARTPSLREGARAGLLDAERKGIESARAALAKAGTPDRPLAEAVVREAEARLHALNARLQADAAKLVEPIGPEARPLALRAKRAEAALAARSAEVRLLKAQAALAKARGGGQGGAPVEKSEAEFAASAKAVAEAFAATATTATDYTPVGPIYPSESTGRRLALARWIAGRANPLTARVAVNHVWARHFGRPLVATVSDFGRNGQAPTHPELLDWLAVEFMETGWSLKALHRRIVTSDAYRRESGAAGPDDPNLASDPENLLYWRMNPRRLEGEAVRDALLLTSGTLDARLGGPELDPEAAMTSGRRSLYLRHAQEKRATFLRVFDSPDANECYRRAETVMPQQALALANSPLAIASARRLAAKLAKEQDADEAFLAASFETILGRPPSDEERTACGDFLRESAARFANGARGLTAFDSGPEPAVAGSSDPRQRAREGLVHALFNHTDFVTIR